MFAAARYTSRTQHTLGHPGPEINRAGIGTRSPERFSPAVRFSMYALGVALLGSRFGVQVGGTVVSIVGPAVLGLAAIAFFRGILQFNRVKAALYILLCSLTLISSSIDLLEPDRFGMPLTWTSLLQFLILTSLFTFRFTQPVEETVFFAAINSIIGAVAACGILQFAAQFAGFGLFSFKGIVPDQFLFELGYNTTIPIGAGNYFKANAFFLLEPSMLSQFMALGLCIEIIALRRVCYIALLLGGLIVSLAGTGWMILGSFIIAVAFGMKSRGVLLAVGTVSLLGAGLIALAFLAPDFFDGFIGRVGEFSAPGSSAHDRFIAPIWALQDVVARAPWAIWVGIGAGISERLSFTYERSMMTPVKILIEFGLPTTITYIALLSSGYKTRAQTVLLVPGLMLVLVTGNYAQVPPMLYPFCLVICIARLTSAEKAPPQSARISAAAPPVTRRQGMLSS